jgi:hypothetical protein
MGSYSSLLVAGCKTDGILRKSVRQTLGTCARFRGAAWFQELLSKNSDLLDPVWSAMAGE